MNLHEYQSKQLFARYGIPVPEGRPARTAAEAEAAARELGGGRWVVKAQVHAGGRGKAGGVKLVDSPEAVREAADALLGTRLVTKQSGAEGLPIHVVLVEKANPPAQELYLSALVDRSRRRIVFVGSAAGGMDIEEVAATSPEKILTAAIDPAAGFQPYQGRRMAFAMGLDGRQAGQLVRIMAGIYRLFNECDASLVEVNPLIVTSGGDLLALDAKVNLDDNALYRQAELAEWRDATQEDPIEHAARQHDLNYVALDGNIGCMVNGAGLAMATMDIIKLHGGEPANFLDVGGGTTAERVAEAFKLILANERVRAILVNIFGGIVRCDLIAEGIIAAAREVDLRVPVVVRLEGTNVERGRELLASSGLDIQPAEDLTDAARKVVAAAAA
ncbi:ADP-forming succinate--CoA ligase subunit beta [Inmirania thermothiophila]|uniref:Succinate--CoA ligase [ADP-forming] subunit beta n=1 Tax=Inmirania thermothiophila TaxID=1750597 RepID=A0A3N1Y792_9GAMM|nr:ADP-forming succinate--CoA ligase subunit beta [Inmirania thermothiophila]ROR34699.1 succinyl-CoA synthetase beta subunit [Inmirania thermothiophila]